ncbi:MAG: oxygenase MpaB family protein [Jatrophihabitans sp.]|uniref:oxygenase MpaB family protein n=1 Tax=Jatrophihabitans sp. TaxID=1932789 RepID=UPI00390FF0AA
MPGYFEADSMAVRVMSNRAVGLSYGQRALVIGAVHPRLYVGTVQHTEHRETPYNRLMLTARLFEAVFLGTKDEADRALEFTRRKHVTVVGAMPEDAGPHYPAGTPYSASDPHLMYMTMAFTFDSVHHMQNLLVRQLSADESEGLWQDFVRWAELFGMPRSAAPASYPEFRAAFDAYLASDKPYLTDEARVVGSYLAGAKRGDYDMAPPLRPLFRVIDVLVKGSLPASVRDLYGFRWTPAHEAAFRGAVQGARALYVQPPRFVPRPLAPILRGPNHQAFKIIAKRERHQLKRGRFSMPEVSAPPGR